MRARGTRYAVIILDGAADYRVRELDGRTPLEVARKPHVDALAKGGVLGTVQTIPAGFEPGSDVAVMSLLGYCPSRYYVGRAPLEAASLGITLAGGEYVLRCNLITEEASRLVDYSGGHVTTDEARELVHALNAELGDSETRFYAGVGYRNILRLGPGHGVAAKTTPPHDIMGGWISELLPTGAGSERLVRLMLASRDVLADHPVNRARVSAGKPPANMTWLWGGGTPVKMPNFCERFGVSGSVISAVDLVRGLAVAVGLNILAVEGATGYYDTNYRGKGEAAIEGLKERDLVVVHVEAPDEAGHDADADEKVKAIEAIDRWIVGPILESLRAAPHRIMIAVDHYTPVSVRTHTREPVPFAIAGEGVQSASGRPYSERDAAQAQVHVPEGHRLMERLLGTPVE